MTDMPDDARLSDANGLLVGAEAVSLDEACRCCAMSRAEAAALIAEGIAAPLAASDDPAQWRFDASTLARLRRARRLQRELELDIAAVALVLDLLEEITRLRARLPRM